MQEIEILKRRVERERKARMEAEAILEDKALQLYQVNEQLRQLNENLEQQVKEGGAKLQKSEKRYQQLIESVQDIIYKISPSGYFTFVNPVVEQRLGYSADEIIGRHFTELVVPEYREQLVNFYWEMVNSQKESTYNDFPVYKKNGEIAWIGQTVRLIESEGNVMELVAVARDITEQVATEDALRTTQTRLSTLITNLQKGVLVEDENRRIILVNQLFCDLFAIPLKAELLIGIDCSQSAEQSKHLFSNPEEFVQRINELLARQEIMINEELHMADGRILERDYVPIFLEGQYRGHLWKYADVTEQYLARESIRKSEEKYRGIMNNMELGLIEVDLEDRICKAYDRFCEMMGYAEEELIGQIASDLFLPEEFRNVFNEQQSIRIEGRATSYEIQMVKKDGSRIWVIVSGAPIMDEYGEIVGSMGIHYDISARKLLEQELALAKEVAEEARQAEKQFLANMSHEIRTPLNAIIGMTHLLFDTRPNKQQYEYLDILKSSADFLHSLISDLLDMAKIEAGRIEVQSHPFDLVGLLRTTQRVFQIKLENRPIELDLMIDGRIAGNYMGDDVMLNQILLNIIGNAEKFTEEGTIEITAKLKKEDNDTVWIEFKIADTGIGIPKEKLELIFQKFKQVNPQGHKHKGTGLGLAITKQLVELQGGTLTVKSEENEGTTFTFTLPFQKSDAEIVKNDYEIEEGSSNLEKCNLLVVEDNIMNQRYISGLLNKWNIPFTIAIDGRKAVEQAHKQQFDIILMDIQMPNMDGYEATLTIRNTTNLNQKTPIVALTASAMLDQKNKTKAVGMDDFITKPFTPTQLLSVIKRFLKAESLKTEPVQDEAPPAKVESLLNYPRIKDLYGDDTEYIVDMMETFLTDALPDFAEFQGLINAQDWVALSKLAHRLKPTLGMVGLTDLEEKMGQLETRARNNPQPESLQLIWSSITDKLENGTKEIQQEIEKLKS
ncbi:PAS domain S-box protein [Runella slithyformis]|uniref:Sensory/regulatory protein RpfC n=1 Tax=Runella slithyformis (strain ATCC 29530 / DSM 19594 / LMG 11500 / NCIMB 11436 / LSU 4) TaxID=761193 RepID=A0A7U4E5J5_RUNSL|nr:PAS domain S-box protein [Runella slithyformis]AEI48656.1 multi-sensor hybrid histidine kinase [Runella slithyformis DSM 19594]